MSGVFSHVHLHSDKPFPHIVPLPVVFLHPVFPLYATQGIYGILKTDAS